MKAWDLPEVTGGAEVGRGGGGWGRSGLFEGCAVCEEKVEVERGKNGEGDGEGCGYEVRDGK